MDKFELITRNTEEIVTEDELKEILKKDEPSAYIGMAPTGKLHIGYFIPIMKIRDFLNAGFKFKILLADIHAHLDDRKAPFELLDLRVEYYKKVITSMLEAVGANVSKLEFVKGSDFELDRKYTLDVYRLAAVNTFDRCKRAAAEVVRFGENPKLSGFIYPIMQTLDEEYLEVDIQYGGIDQRKILMFARENLPKIGYKSRTEVMTPMLPGLTGSKMSASDTKSKIDIIDIEKDVKKKINSAFCPEGVVEENGVLSFMKYVVMVLKEDKGEDFVIERPEKFGGNVSYSTYEALESDFAGKKLHPMDLKSGLVAELNKMLEPVREGLKDSEELIKKAYPEE
jgi:tyrosyl-tRNA synthetase